MTRPIVLSNFLEHDIQALLTQVYNLKLERYDNPFERKSFLADKTGLDGMLWAAFKELMSSETCHWVSRILDVPIFSADFSHYGNIFVYNQGDYLEPHVDAGIHPIKQQRKVATALLYLTQAQLAFWRGDSCTFPNPEVWTQTQTLTVDPNQLVLFVNDDNAWHSVPYINSAEPRVVLTISYLAPPDFVHPKFTNKRTRAYFAKQVGKPDTPAMQDLRDKRASESGHQDVWRTQ